MENNIPVKASWLETKEKIQKQFERLSNNDLRQKVEEQDAMLLRIQQKLGNTKEEIRQLIAGETSEIIIPLI